MVGATRIWEPGRPIEHEGVFTEGPWLVEYETSEPAPDHWVAIGFASQQLASGATMPVMVVGSGQTELAARSDLRRRIAGFSAPDDEDEFVMDWALMASEASEVPS